MTAEIIIMNKEAIAFAADSAVTVRGSSQDKIFSSANKLFSLSKYCPVGIMIFGNALFMEIPWEVMIKTYRSKLGNHTFNTLEGYANNFVAFLESSNRIFTPEIERRCVQSYTYSFFNHIKQGDLPPRLAAPALRIQSLYKHTPLAFCDSMSCAA